jgi:hypothetical protein
LQCFLVKIAPPLLKLIFPGIIIFLISEPYTKVNQNTDIQNTDKNRPAILFAQILFHSQSRVRSILHVFASVELIQIFITETRIKPEEFQAAI